MIMGLIIKFLVLTFIVAGGIIFFLHRSLVASTEGAVQKLNEENNRMAAQQEELSKKIKEASEELAEKQKEASELTNRMRSEVEEEFRAERDKIVGKAREEGEDIIAKAQGSKEKIRFDMEKDNDIKVVKYAMEILNDVLSEESKGPLDDVLIKEFLEKLKDIDMSRISADINTIDIVGFNPVNDFVKSQILSIVKDKLGRDVSVNTSTDESIGGGLILRFGSMALDGSVQNLIRERGIVMQEQIEMKES
ncbi:MAG: F0F1 ATP synthase subunit delta [Candidatus Zapsychrus exili]|nr:F0F1 ATP synthase subunit delta [Candidatus Zapsychrus exili]